MADSAIVPSPTRLLRALGQFEQLHARGNAPLVPAEQLRGAVLGIAAVEHRFDRPGLLVGVERFAHDVLERTVDLLLFGIAVEAGDHLQSLEPGRLRSVKAGDQDVVVAIAVDGGVGVDDLDRVDHRAARSNRAAQRRDPLLVDLADVVVGNEQPV